MASPSVQRLRLAAFLCLAAHAAVPAAAEEPAGSFGAAVDVDLVEIAVRVSDPDGGRVDDLAPSDFVVRVDGKPVELSHVEPPAPELPAPRTILWVDLRELDPNRIGTLVDSVRQEIPRLAERTEGVAVAVRRGRGWRLVQPFSRDADAILSAVDSAVAGASGNLRASDVRRLFDQIGAVDRPRPDAGDGLLDAALRARAESAASLLLTEMRMTIPELVDREVATLEAPLAMLAAAAGIPGPKALLWIGAAVDPEPGKALIEAWLGKFQDTDFVNRTGNLRIEDTGGGRVSAAVDTLIDRARAGRVALYMLAPPEDPRRSGDLDTQTRYQPRGAPSRSLAVAGLAAATGGQTATSVELRPLVDRMLGDRTATYDLSFLAPRTAEAELHEVEVEVARKGLKLRYPGAFRDRTPRRRLAERALGALIFEETDNPLGFDLAPGKPSRDGDEVVLPVTVGFPLRRLTFVPAGDGQEARVSAAVVPRRVDAEEVGQVSSGEVPLRYASSEMAVVRRTRGTFTAAVSLGPGSWQIGFALRDELSGDESAARLDLEISDDGEVTTWAVATRRPPPPPAEALADELPPSPVAEAEPGAPETPAEPADAPARRRLAAEARSAYRDALSAWVAGTPLADAAAAWAVKRAELARLPTPDPDLLAHAWQDVAVDLVEREPAAAFPLAAFDAALMRVHTARHEPPLIRDARLGAAELLDRDRRKKKPAIPTDLAARAWLILAADTTVREFTDVALERAVAAAPELDVVVLAAAAEAERADQPERALAVLAPLLVRDPGNGEAQLRRALAERRAGRADASQTELEGLVDDPAAPAWVRSLAVQELARDELAARRADLALARVHAAVEAAPDDPQLLVLEAWIVDRLGGSDRARTLLDGLAAREGRAQPSPRALYSRTLLERVAPLRDGLVQAAQERLASLALALAESGDR